MRHITSSIIAAILWLVTASAASLKFDLLVSGTSPSSLQAATLTVTDLGNDLRLTFDGSGLTGTESVKSLWFNLPGGSTLNQSAKVGTFADPSVNGPGAFNGFGGSYSFGYLVEFATAPPGQRFGSGDSVEFLLTAAYPLDESHFTGLVSVGTAGPMLAGIHVIALADGSSAKVGAAGDCVVPEPSTYAALFALGLVGFAGWRRYACRIGLASGPS